MSSEGPAHDPAAVFDALHRHEVEHVTIGGLAVGFWGHPRATKDTDIVIPPDDPPNDARLRAALAQLCAEPLPLEAPEALGIAWKPEGDVERWRTLGGVLDVMAPPEGARSYAQLRARAVPAELFGAPTVIAAREDLVAMKLAAARIQDLLDLDALVDPRNMESSRARLRLGDRELLGTDGEPVELGEPVDPCEGHVDGLRRALAPSSARAQLERDLTRRARELRTVADSRLRELDQQPLPEIPASIQGTAAVVAEAARKIGLTEQREFGLLRQREGLPAWQRRRRGELRTSLNDATDEVEQLREQAERGVDDLRKDLKQIGAWWDENGKTAVDAIAVRREHYRRDRQRHAELVRAAPERPAEYVTALIGQRPAKRRDEWDRAVRSIEAYLAQHAPGAEALLPPEAPGRAQRGAWERMARAVRALGVELPA